jgi:hypothetical protein
MRGACHRLRCVSSATDHVLPLLQGTASYAGWHYFPGKRLCAVIILSIPARIVALHVASVAGACPWPDGREADAVLAFT